MPVLSLYTESYVLRVCIPLSETQGLSQLHRHCRAPEYECGRNRRTESSVFQLQCTKQAVIISNLTVPSILDNHFLPLCSYSTSVLYRLAREYRLISKKCSVSNFHIKRTICVRATIEGETKRRRYRVSDSQGCPRKHFTTRAMFQVI